MRGAQGDLAQVFAWLAAEPGIGVVTGEPGVGKTAAMRHLCRSLPASEHRVVYLCDCAVKPLDLYRMLAVELGLKPSPRAQIVSDIKAALVSLVDEHSVVPIVILDEAQGLRDDLLHELHGLCSLDLDGRDYLTIWLVGHPRLARRLRLKQHTARPRPRADGRQDRSSAPRRDARSWARGRGGTRRARHRRGPAAPPSRVPWPAAARQPAPPPRAAPR